MFSKNLRRIRFAMGLGINELGRKTGLSPSYLSALERDIKTNPSKETMEKISEVLNVPLDRLMGESASSIIEDKIRDLGLTMPELAERAGISINTLLNLDSLQPDDYDYEAMTKIAKALDIQPGVLRSALARQEPPVYDGPRSSPEEDFAIVAEDPLDYIEDWTKEELEEIEKFKDFLRMKRNHKKG